MLVGVFLVGAFLFIQIIERIINQWVEKGKIMKSSETVDKIEKSTLVTCRKFQYNSKRGMQFSLN